MRLADGADELVAAFIGVETRVFAPKCNFR
jgi:hypothetical protein